MNPIKQHFKKLKQKRYELYLCYIKNKEEIDLLKEYNNYKFYNSSDSPDGSCDYYFVIEKDDDTEDLILICSNIKDEEFYNVEDLIEEFRNNSDQN